MRKAKILVKGIEAGVLEEQDGHHYTFTYHSTYHDSPVSLTMPLSQQVYEYERFPPFFEGLLPERVMLEGLLRHYKIDKNDFFSQLVQVGKDLVGAITVESIE